MPVSISKQWKVGLLRLVGEGWAEPDAAFDEGDKLIGCRVRVQGYGEGVVVEYQKVSWGPSCHRIQMVCTEDGRPVLPSESERLLRLRRKHNNEVPWLVYLGNGGPPTGAQLLAETGRIAVSTAPAAPVPPPPEGVECSVVGLPHHCSTDHSESSEEDDYDDGEPAAPPAAPWAAPVLSAAQCKGLVALQARFRGRRGQMGAALPLRLEPLWLVW
jgi:hypothetical protein